MHRLSVFGRLDLRTPAGDEVRSVLAQPKRLAVLLYLALEGRFVQRDLLQALFWPESDGTRARQSLNRTVHFLRQALGEDALVSRGPELGVDAGGVSSDAADFLGLEAEGRLEEAMRQYQGEVSPGFHAGGGVPDFDLWLEDRRSDFRRRARRAAQELAVRCAAEGAQADAEAWARRAVSVDPLDEESVRRLMTLLADGGNRAGALEAYAQLGERLAQTLDIPPDPATTALAEAIAVRLATLSTGAATPARGEQPPQADAGRSAGARIAAPAAVRPVADGVPLPSSRPARPMLGWVAAPLVAVLAVLVWAGLSLVRDEGSTPPEDDRERVRTENPVAFEAFRTGRAALDRGHFQEAIAAYRSALAADPELARAYVQLSIAANEAGDYQLATWAADQGMGRVQGMGRLDSLFTVGWYHQINVRPAEAIEAYRALVAETLDPEALTNLADVLFHWGPTLGHPAVSTIPLWRQALTLRPGLVSALTHLIRLEALAGDVEGASETLRVIRDASPDPERLIEAEVLAAATTRDAAEVERLVPALATLTPRQRGGIATLTGVFAPPSPEKDRLMEAAARGVAPGSSGVEILRAMVLGAERGWDAGDAYLQTHLTDFPERRVQARANLAVSLAGSPPTDTLASLLRQLRSSDPDAFVGAMDDAVDGIYPPRRLFLLTVLAVEVGDTGQAREARRALGAYTPRTQVDGLRRDEYVRVADAYLALKDGSPALALEHLGDPHPPVDRLFPDLLNLPDGLSRWIRAEALARLGRTAEARTWFQTFPQTAGNDVAFRERAKARAEELR